MNRNGTPRESKTTSLPVPEAMIALTTALGAAEEEWNSLVARLQPVMTPANEKEVADDSPQPKPERLSQEISATSVRVNHLVNKMRAVRGQLEL
jgi:hypothetical protein